LIRPIRIAASLVAMLVSATCLAFDSKGHVVIEALAYRTLIEGHDVTPPQPDVLRDLFNDGALDPPICFGLGPAPPGYCVDPAKTNPLLEWPRPLTDQPDAAFRRQFSDPGQCFHFMATFDDAKAGDIEGTEIPRGLATSAIVRCRDLMHTLLRQVVVVGGPATRRSAYGLYEMMHAIGDSFSGAHSERKAGTHAIEYLRIWKPLERLVGIPTERTKGVPAAVFHTWNDHRDKEYVLEERAVPTASGAEPKKCKDLTSFPYEVPFECLSESGDQARQALVELLVLVRNLRREHLAGGAGAASTAPEQSEAWRAYEEKWFTAAYACQNGECAVKQPPDLLPGAYGTLGLGFIYNGSRKFFDVTARGSLVRYSWELNPFVYSVQGDIGYRHFSSGDDSAIAGLSLDLVVPIGRRADLGFTPGEFRVAFGGAKNGTDFTTRLFRFDWRAGDRTFLTFTGPMEVNWRRPAVEWSLGVGISWAPSASQAASSGALLTSSSEKAERRDDGWSPPAAPYGRLEGRRPNWYVGVGTTTAETPDNALSGRVYGGGSIGGSVMWDRDRWGGRFETAPAVSLALGSRRTSGESTYLTGILGVGMRWYVLRVLGLSITPVRLEGGPKIRGSDENDPSPDVHGDPGSQYYFQGGSRVGIALNAGIIDLLVEAPTIAWRSQPFKGGEILSVSLAIRLR